MGVSTRWISVGATVVLLIAAHAEGATEAQTPCEFGLPTALRILESGLEQATANALHRSPTLCEQILEIEAHHGVVYVMTRPIVRPGSVRSLVGMTVNQLDRAGDVWIARIVVKRSHDDAALATLGHELRHVVEILTGSDERDRFEVFSGIVETHEAQRVEARILRELHATR